MTRVNFEVKSTEVTQTLERWTMKCVAHSQGAHRAEMWEGLFTTQASSAVSVKLDDSAHGRMIYCD